MSAGRETPKKERSCSIPSSSETSPTFGDGGPHPPPPWVLFGRFGFFAQPAGRSSRGMTLYFPLHLCVGLGVSLLLIGSICALSGRRFVDYASCDEPLSGLRWSYRSGSKKPHPLRWRLYFYIFHSEGSACVKHAQRPLRSAVRLLYTKEYDVMWFDEEGCDVTRAIRRRPRGCGRSSTRIRRQLPSR
jgi:hypothetical protein